MSRLELKGLLAGFGVSDDMQGRLCSVLKSDDANQRLRLQVTNEMIADIPIETRGNIYKYLQEDNANIAQANAFRFCGRSVDEWFRGSGLRPKLSNLVKSMVYRHGNYLLFADLRLIQPELRNDEEKHRLLKTLGRDSTYAIRLQFDDQSDVNKLVRYWGHGGRAKDVRPMLESLSLQQSGSSIDISHLLTPFARRILYTYPNLTSDDVVGRRDCHWTAHNFSNEKLDDRLVIDPVSELPRVLEHEYFEIFGELQLGDLVIYVDEVGQAFHSAVFIAEDIVFTKNGHSTLGPWHFRRLDEMNDFYCRREAVQMVYYRRKNS